MLLLYFVAELLLLYSIEGTVKSFLLPESGITSAHSLLLDKHSQMMYPSPIRISDQQPVSQSLAGHRLA